MEYQDALREVVATSVYNGVPTPGFSASINYYDSYRSEDLPANLIQAQRDYFGAHTYERKDREGIFHTQWVEEYLRYKNLTLNWVRFYKNFNVNVFS